MGCGRQSLNGLPKSFLLLIPARHEECSLIRKEEATSGSLLSCRLSSSSVGGTAAFQYRLTSSAHRFNLMVQDFFEDVGPLLSMQLGGQTLAGLFQVFNFYVNMLIKALPDSMEEEANFEGLGNKIVRLSETEAQQIALLANASLLADELLPHAAMKLSPLRQLPYKDDVHGRPADRQNRHPEQREWKRKLVRSVDRLKDTFCQQHVLELIFPEEGDSRLIADIYINMDGHPDDIDWFPSSIFRELFAKLTRMASMAADMFVGRERFATLLLMRLTETVIFWLSGDQSSFRTAWLPTGASITLLLVFIFWAWLLDVLPEDEWFKEVCLDAMDRLSGKPRAINGDKEITSPTASASAPSISSAQSLGSA